MRKESEKILKKEVRKNEKKQEQARILRKTDPLLIKTWYFYNNCQFSQRKCKTGCDLFLNANVGLLIWFEKFQIVTGSERLSLKKAGKTTIYVKAEKINLK